MVTTQARTMTIGTRFASLAAITLGFAMIGCGGAPGAEETTGTTSFALSPQTSTHAATFARQWMTNVAFTVKFENANPLIAVRSYAYAAIAGYEAVVHGMPGYLSLAGQLNGLSSLPVPDASLTYDWPTVLAATEGRVVNATFVHRNLLFFEYTSAGHVSLGSLEGAQIAQRRVQAGIPQSVIDASVSYGHTLGDAIAAWANADGFAETRYQAYIPPTSESSDWVATGYVDATSSRPVLPYFGDVRTLAIANGSSCAPPPHAPFSTDPASDFYAQANEVYQTDLNLTKAQRETALYWADGGGSETPPGHWVKITNDLVRPGTLDAAVRAYVSVAVPMFDAGVATWHTKYLYNLLRPETYIHRYINPQWITLITTPEFPSYTSGHSGFSGAAAKGLTSVFGAVPFTDKTKVRAGFEARSYPNFMAAADDAAVSRLYGGIHYRMDNEQGEVLGRCVGDAFTARVSLHL
jgi:hypothetical protein